MNKRHWINIILIIVVVILIIVIWYFNANKNSLANNQTNNNQTSTSEQNNNQPTAIEYKNTDYGFSFALPVSWQGYTIVTDQWQGTTAGEQGDVVVQEGPKISIRHPLWTEANPRQDIPIMIFTIEQWNLLQQDKFHIGAAPIGPSELGRNTKYVFALPARYNFAFPTGYEEVQTILDNKPLKTF